MPRLATHLAVLAVVAVGLSGCGAGDPGPDAPTIQRPPTTPTAPTQTSTKDIQLRLETFEVPDGAAPHDVAPAADGGIWFTAQGAGYLGHLDPASRAVTQVPLGTGSRPHGVIVGADGAAWVTDSGLNAIVRVDGHRPCGAAVPVAG